MLKKILPLLLIIMIGCGGGGGGGGGDDTGGGTGPTNDPPVAIFTATPTTGNAPLSVTFVSTSTNTSAHQWDFDNDGSLDAAGATVAYTYNNAGTYSVSLTATGPGGTDTNTKTDFITVLATAPIAEFSTATEDEISGIVPHNVNFVNGSSNYSSSSWDFGDGNTSTEENPRHTYESSGTFDVSLTAIGDGGETVETKSSYIIVEDLQTPAFKLNPKYIETTTGSTISFDVEVVGVTGLAAAQATLRYDNSLLTLGDITAGDFLKGNTDPLLVITSNPGVGRVIIYTSSLSSDQPSSDGDGVIATVNFTVDGSTDTSVFWGDDAAGAAGGGNYMLDANGAEMTFNGKDNVYIYVE